MPSCSMPKRIQLLPGLYKIITIRVRVNIDPSAIFQVCPNCTEGGQDCPYTAIDWLFMPDPGLFGLIGGWANPTGMALLVVVTFMSLSSMPFVRRGGFFQVNHIEIGSMITSFNIG